MKKRLTMLLAFVLVGAMLALTACGKKPEPEPEPEPVVEEEKEELEEIEEEIEEVEGEAVEEEPEEEAAAEEPAGAEGADVAGKYYPFAAENQGVCIEIPEEDRAEMGGVITLNEDGTGSMLTGDQEMPILWEIQGTKMIWKEESGTIQIPISMEYKDGILLMDSPVEEEDGSVIRMYFAREGTDTSSIETITVEEYQQSQGQ